MLNIEYQIPVEMWPGIQIVARGLWTIFICDKYFNSAHNCDLFSEND
jgi:hypothetical protein